MKKDYSILEILPTPVYTIIIPNTIFKDSYILYNQDIEDSFDSNNYGFVSKNRYILNNIELKNLSDYILSKSIFFLETLGYDYKACKFDQSWISVKSPGQSHFIHTHYPKGLVSGVFYYDDYEEHTSAIKFHRKLETQDNYYHIDYLKSNNNTAYEEYSIEIKKGLLILFPSYLPHSVPKNTTNINRNSLAFDVIPI